MDAKETLKNLIGVEILSDLLKLHAKGLIMNQTASNQTTTQWCKYHYTTTIIILSQSLFFNGIDVDVYNNNIISNNNNNIFCYYSTSLSSTSTSLAQQLQLMI